MQNDYVHVEQVPDNYVRPDVTITIYANNRGSGVAELIAAKIMKLLVKYKVVYK